MQTIQENINYQQQYNTLLQQTDELQTLKQSNKESKTIFHAIRSIQNQWNDLKTTIETNKEGYEHSSSKLSNDQLTIVNKTVDCFSFIGENSISSCPNETKEMMILLKENQNSFLKEIHETIEDSFNSIDFTQPNVNEEINQTKNELDTVLKKVFLNGDEHQLPNDYLYLEEITSHCFRKSRERKGEYQKYLKELEKSSSETKKKTTQRKSKEKISPIDSIIRPGSAIVKKQNEKKVKQTKQSKDVKQPKLLKDLKEEKKKKKENEISEEIPRRITRSTRSTLTENEIETVVSNEIENISQSTDNETKLNENKSPIQEEQQMEIENDEEIDLKQLKKTSSLNKSEEFEKNDKYKEETKPKKAKLRIVDDDEDDEDVKEKFDPFNDDEDDEEIVQKRTNDPCLFGKKNEYIRLKMDFYLIFHNNKYDKKLSIRRTYDENGEVKPSKKGITLSKKEFYKILHNYNTIKQWFD